MPEAATTLVAAHEGESEVLLVTGFGPFGEYRENPSADIAEAVDRQRFDGVRVIGRRLDVRWRNAWESVRSAVDEHRPNALLCLGVGPAPSIRLEILAKNTAAACADAFGEMPVLFDGSRILANGPSFYRTTLPVDWLSERLRQRRDSLSSAPKTLASGGRQPPVWSAGRAPDCSMEQEADAPRSPVLIAPFIHGEPSSDAGSYLCNFVFYHVMHFLGDRVPFRGFIHVPPYGLGLLREEVQAAGAFLVAELARWMASDSPAPCAQRSPQGSLGISVPPLRESR